LPLDYAQEDTVPRLDVTIAAAVAGFPSDHSAVRAADAEFRSLVRDIPELAGLVRERTVVEEGVKGPWSEIALSLTGPAAVAGFVRLVALWLRRPQKRQLRLTAETVVDGQVRATRTVTLEGESISEETVRTALEQLRADGPE
jgi:hypothetical protein